MLKILLTKAEAKTFLSGNGMSAFVFARKLRQQARTKANEAGQPCVLVCGEDILFTASPLHLKES